MDNHLSKRYIDRWIDTYRDKFTWKISSRLEKEILTNRTDIGMGGADGLIGWEVIGEFQHLHFVRLQFYKLAGYHTTHTRQEVMESYTSLVFTDIAIFMRATKTERKPQESEQDFLECPLHRSAAPPRLPSSSNFYIQALDPEVGCSKKTSSPRIYQRIHWKQRRYDHFFFSLSAFCLHTCTAGDSAETSASNSGQKMRYCPLISPLLNISAIYPPIYYTICIEIKVIIR